MLVELTDIYGAPWWVNPDHVVALAVATHNPGVWATAVEVITGRDNRGSIGNTIVIGKVSDIAAKLNAARDR
jgi:hypothetical protein